MRIDKGVNREIIGEANLLVVRRGDGRRVYKCNGLNVGTGTMRSVEFWEYSEKERVE